jgi:hypothetical protein
VIEVIEFIYNLEWLEWCSDSILSYVVVIVLCQWLTIWLHPPLLFIQFTLKYLLSPWIYLKPPKKSENWKTNILSSWYCSGHPQIQNLNASNCSPDKHFFPLFPLLTRAPHPNSLFPSLHRLFFFLSTLPLSLLGEVWELRPIFFSPHLSLRLRKFLGPSPPRDFFSVDETSSSSKSTWRPVPQMKRFTFAERLWPRKALDPYTSQSHPISQS